MIFCMEVPGHAFWPDGQDREGHDFSRAADWKTTNGFSP